MRYVAGCFGIQSTNEILAGLVSFGRVKTKTSCITMHNSAHNGAVPGRHGVETGSRFRHMH